MTTYERFIERAVRDRDEVFFKPWLLNREEGEFGWLARTVAHATREFSVPRDRALADLTDALERRHAHNRRNVLRRLPAVPRLAYHLGLRRALSVASRPVLWWRHIGPAFDRQSPTVELPSSRGEGQISARDQTKTATIVVLSYNRRQYLVSTLNALHATTPRDVFELIVVDNGSTDGSAAMLRELAKTDRVDKVILRRKNHGISAGFNIGFAHAAPDSRFLVKLDSDIKILAPGWLDRFRAFFSRSPETGLLALRQVNHPAHTIAPRDVVAGEQVISWNFWIVGSACMTIPRAVFDRLGYFSEDFTINYTPDDIDYYMRVSALGLRAYYLCDATAYHRHDLDRRYAANERQKKRELPISRADEEKVYRGYLRGTRPLDQFYPHYADRTFPSGEKVYEVD